MSSMIIRSSRLLEVAPLYDAFILDQWGVMHDGVNGLYKAAAVVAELARLGKELINCAT